MIPSHHWQHSQEYRKALRRFVTQSNLIEGIDRPPTIDELNEADRFIHLEKVTIDDLEMFVSVYQPGARLRRQHGMNVRVGGYIPPGGGYQIEGLLRDLLADIRSGLDPWTAHCRYETIHPFSDGNGRSGRILWAWQMGPAGGLSIDFLHHFYYQTLQNFPGRRRR